MLVEMRGGGGYNENEQRIIIYYQSVMIKEDNLNLSFKFLEGF